MKDHLDPVVEKLLEISGSSFSAENDEPVFPGGPSMPNQRVIDNILARRNGFFAFEQALRFFPKKTVAMSWGIDEWNGTALWKREYRGLADNLFCFAEDIFGEQFCLSGDEVVIFHPETGDIEPIARTVAEWASKILLDWRFLTGHPFAKEWQERAGTRLAPRERLMAKLPFVLGGAFELSNLAAVEAGQLMRTLGNLARQIHDLSDGAKVRLVVTRTADGRRQSDQKGQS